MKSELYLCGKLVDMSDVISFPLNKTFENMTNPTDIVNEWSKSIKLPITKANNEILANAYRLDRTVLAKTGYTENIGKYLDPTKKIPFTLLNNGDLLIRGYAKLSLVDFSINDRFYTINLYGDLGDLFQKMLNFAASIEKCPKMDNDKDSGKSDIWEDDYKSQLKRYAIACKDGIPVDEDIRQKIQNWEEGYESYKYEWYDSRYLIDDHMSGEYMLNNEYVAACWENEPSKKAEDVELHRAPTMSEISGGEFDKVLTPEQLERLDDDKKEQYFEYLKEYEYKKIKNDTGIIGFMPTHHGFPNDFDGASIQYQKDSPLTLSIAYSTWGIQKRTNGTYGVGDIPTTVSTSIEDLIEEQANNKKQKWNAADLVGDGLYEEQIGQFVSWQQKPYVYFNKLFQMFQYVFRRDKEEFGSKLFEGYELEIDDKWTCYDEETDKYINPYWYKFVYTFDFLFNRDNTSFTRTNILGEAEPQTRGGNYNFIFDNERGDNEGYGNQGNRDDYTYYNTEVVVDSEKIRATSENVAHQTLTLGGYYWMVLPVVIASTGQGWGNNQIPDVQYQRYSPKELFHIGKYNNVMFLLQADVESNGKGVSTAMCGFRNYNFLYADTNLGDDREYDLQFYQTAKEIIGDKVYSIHSEMIIVDKWFGNDEITNISGNKLLPLERDYKGNPIKYIVVGMPLKALGEINVGLQDYTLKIKGGFTVEGYKNSYQGHDSTRAYATLSVSKNSDDGYLFAYGSLWPISIDFATNTPRRYDPQYQNGFISYDIFEGQYASMKHSPDTNIRANENLQWISEVDFTNRMVTGYGLFTSDVSCLDSKHNIPITLKDVFDAEKPLFNIILEYGKMFGLLWTVDYENKKIRLQSRYTTFNGYNDTIQDWSDKVDRTKDYQITPILHESRYLNFDYEKEDDACHYTDYGEKYATQYGGYKLKTGYDFTPDSEDVFKGIHTAIFSNRAYITLDDMLNYTPSHPCIAKMSPLCLMDCDSKDGTSPISIQNWCFRNSNISPFDLKDRKFYLVDDTPLMQAQGKYSYLDIENVDSSLYLQISTFPVFNIVTGDYGSLFSKPILDFTTPDEGETETLLKKTPSEGFIYKKIWEKWMNERYNVNNKKLTCYINLSPSEYSTFEFKNFKIIDGQLFMLNRIIDFNPNDSETTKCEFIQITNPDVYVSEEQINFTDFDVVLEGSYDESIAERYDDYYYKISPEYWGSHTTDETGDYYDGDNYITVRVDCVPETAGWTLKTWLRPTKQNQTDVFGNEKPYGSAPNEIRGVGSQTIQLYTMPSFYPTIYDNYQNGSPWDYNLRILCPWTISVKADSGESRVVTPWTYSRALEFALNDTISNVLDVDVDGKLSMDSIYFTNSPNLDVEVGFVYNFYSLLAHYQKTDGRGDIQNTYDHFIIPTSNSVINVYDIADTVRHSGVIRIEGNPCYDGYTDVLRKYLTDNGRSGDIDKYQNDDTRDCADESERCTFIAFRLVDKTKKDVENIWYTSNEAPYGWVGANYENYGGNKYTDPLFNSNFVGVDASVIEDTSDVWCDPLNVVQYARENAINFINRTAFNNLAPQDLRKGTWGKTPMKNLHNYFWDYYEKDGWAFALFRQPMPIENSKSLSYTISSTEAHADGDHLNVWTSLMFDEYSVGCPDFCHITQTGNDTFDIVVDSNLTGYDRTFDVVISVPNSDIIKVITIHQYCFPK